MEAVMRLALRSLPARASEGGPRRSAERACEAVPANKVKRASS
jgi:hypothetical protein